MGYHDGSDIGGGEVLEGLLDLLLVFSIEG